MMAAGVFSQNKTRKNSSRANGQVLMTSHQIKLCDINTH